MTGEPETVRGGTRRSWSWPSRLLLAAAGTALLCAALGHLGLVFLHVAPENVATVRARPVMDRYIYPELEQNWQLFAPNPLARNESVQARASVVSAHGDVRVTSWRDLTARDVARIRHDPLPSHLDQNELRRAWDLYASSHDPRRGERAYDERGRIVGDYLRRVLLERLSPQARPGDRILRVQARGRFVLVDPPSWDPGKRGAHRVKPWYRTLPWWNIEPADRGEGPGPAGAGGRP